MKLSELNQVHSCDKCHKTFKSNEIATVPFGSNVTIIASIYIINDNDTIITTYYQL